MNRTIILASAIFLAVSGAVFADDSTEAPKFEMKQIAHCEGPSGSISKLDFALSYASGKLLGFVSQGTETASGEAFYANGKVSAEVALPDVSRYLIENTESEYLDHVFFAHGQKSSRITAVEVDYYARLIRFVLDHEESLVAKDCQFL